MAALSLNGNKTITTGNGGLLFLKNPAWAARARLLIAQSRCDDFDFFYGEAAYNFQMSNISAALGVAQIKRLPEILEKKNRIRECYRQKLQGPSLYAKNIQYPAWLNLAEFPRALTRAEMRSVAQLCAEEGIRVRPAFPPVTANAMYRDAPAFQTNYSEYLFHHCLCLPSGPGLSEEAVDRVVAVLARAASGLRLL